MSLPLKEQIKADLDKARLQGELRAKRIKMIVQSAVSQANAELKIGRKEIAPIVKDVLSSVIEALKDKQDPVQLEVSAAISGVVEAIETSKRAELSQTQGEIRRLEAQVDVEEVQLQEDIRDILSEIQQTNQDQSPSIKSAIQTAIDQLQESEEIKLMRKRYAQLKTQLAVVQAYLVNRYGDRYEAEVTEYLEDAKAWYQRAKHKPNFFTSKVEQKWQQFETKLANIGTELAKRERKDKQLLLELWQSLSESSN
ncbi:MAG: hypothetical protein HC851_18670 [Acaryochloris sp. RU_4_1]|nr:hypothetical protein [Acaryochloris sp. RU_4_1]NJR54224.1 hypothetical protein [Acaryochloris sp. CRU_2_0]